MENKNLKEMSLKDLIMTHYAISKNISNMYAEINKIKKQRTEVHTTILEHADMQKHVENSSATRNNVCDKGDDKLTIKVNNNVNRSTGKKVIKSDDVGQIYNSVYQNQKPNKIVYSTNWNTEIGFCVAAVLLIVGYLVHSKNVKINL